MVGDDTAGEATGDTAEGDLEATGDPRLVGAFEGVSDVGATVLGVEVGAKVSPTAVGPRLMGLLLGLLLGL